jgi:hypothetical protein
VVECLGWWPPDDPADPPPYVSPFFLHQALADPACRLAPLQEQVDGAWCHVVERPGVDKLWLDGSIGFFPRRRLWFHDHPSIDGMTYELEDYREVSADVWIPMRLRRKTYRAGSSPAPGEAAPAKDVTIELINVEVNNVPLERFQFRPEPGTLLYNDVSTDVRQVPGGLDFLDKVIAIAGRRAAVLKARWPERAWNRLPVDWRWIAAPAMLGGAIILLVYRVFTRMIWSQ